MCSSSRFGSSATGCLDVSPSPFFFLFPLHKGAVIAAPAGWQWFREEYPKGHNRILLYVAEQGTENLSPCCRHARFLSTWLTRLVARGSTTDGNERPAGHWSHLDPCFLSSRGFGRRSGPSVCWGEGCCFEPQPTCQPGTPPSPPQPGLARGGGVSLVTAHLAWPGGEDLVPMGGGTLFKRPLLMPACRGRIPIGDVDSVLSIHVLVTSRLDRNSGALKSDHDWDQHGSNLSRLFL